MRFSREIYGASIVVTGNFNPVIFTPDWLRLHKLIGEGDADFTSTTGLVGITPQLTQFSTEWFELQVLRTRFVLVAKGGVTLAVRDLAAGIFSLLSHTPVSAVGLNFTSQYRVPAVEDWHLIGDTLAPKEIWHDVLSDKSINIGVENLQLVIQHGLRTDLQKVQDNLVRVIFRPSVEIPHGVYIEINHHFATSNDVPEGKSQAEHLSSVIASNWERCEGESNRIVEALMHGILKST